MKGPRWPSWFPFFLSSILPTRAISVDGRNLPHNVTGERSKKRWQPYYWAAHDPVGDVTSAYAILALLAYA